MHLLPLFLYLVESFRTIDLHKHRINRRHQQLEGPRLAMLGRMRVFVRLRLRWYVGARKAYDCLQSTTGGRTAAVWKPLPMPQRGCSVQHSYPEQRCIIDKKSSSLGQVQLHLC